MNAEMGLIQRLGLSFPSAVRELFDRWPAMVQLSNTALVLVVFIVFEFVILRASRLPAEAYFEPILTVALVEHFGWLLSIGTSLFVVVLSRYGTLLRPWETIERRAALRVFVVFLAFVIAWPLTTYGYNYYFDQAHSFDRIALVVLVFLLWWRPLFIYPFVLLAFVLLWQIAEPPLGGSVLAHKLQVLHVLNLFASYLAVRCIFGDVKSGVFIFLACCLVATAYWLPAFGKFQIDWLQHSRLDLVIPAAYAHGWMASLDAETVIAFADTVQPLKVLLALFAIGIETLFLLFLIFRRASLGLLLAAIVFHVGVFAIYGFFFWTWILVDAALFVLLFHVADGDRWIYSRPQLAFSIVLIASGAYWAHPPQLAWHDTRLTYTIRIDAIDAEGNSWPLRPEFFGPYDDVMTMSTFPYLIKDHARLVGSYGVTPNARLADAINTLTSGAELLELEALDTTRQFNEERANMFYEFVLLYVSNRLRSGERLTASQVVAAPPQFWGFRGEKTAEIEDIRFIAISEITTFFDGQSITAVRERELNLIAMGSDPQ